MAASEVAKRMISALFYAFCSFSIVVVNKLVLTSYSFPSEVLAFGQMCATIVILFVAKTFRLVDYPALSMELIRNLFPLPIIFFGNIVCGLGGTKRISLPMFTVLRRFSILMTMLLEQFLLGNRRSFKMQLAVYMMILGAIIAAWYDLSFNMVGYIMIFISDLATALNGVYTMKKLQIKELGKYGILFYNSLFMVIPTALFTQYTGGFDEARNAPWDNHVFTAEFCVSCVMGFILNYSIVLCTQYNSALTTTIVGVMKNIFVTYMGMFIGGDYVFSVMNFIGLNLSLPLASWLCCPVPTMAWVPITHSIGLGWQAYFFFLSSAAASVFYSYLEFAGKKKPVDVTVKPVAVSESKTHLTGAANSQV